MNLNASLTRTSMIVTLSLAALLTGCGGSDSTSGNDQASGATKTAPAPGAASPSGTAAPGPHNPADVAFASGMIPHHEQAVEMSELLLAKDGVEPPVRKLAEEIKAAQGPEITQLRGWLANWGEPAPMESMAGMDHGTTSLPGMMTAEQMRGLETASGKQARDLFLEQMIAHHRGAIEMAGMELRDGQNSDAKALAQRIIDAQQSEITTMSKLLAG